ncbi:hypothetical protein Y032_0102g3459 [Ancylostoma ceylanicum]|uniref:Uncharacterized protein n=1 Tax=Ancylostoma ceylanicum TaxID=53326 RepID=A0A016TH93_9BILA|nr:hypothetical protein Y032_0102g3459 [Ancylostoma ceylanicum]
MHSGSRNFVDEYADWKLSLGQHLPEDTKIRHFLKQMLKKVVINPNDFNKLTVRVRDSHDGLILSTAIVSISTKSIHSPHGRTRG